MEPTSQPEVRAPSVVSPSPSATGAVINQTSDWPSSDADKVLLLPHRKLKLSPPVPLPDVRITFPNLTEVSIQDGGDVDIARAQFPPALESAHMSAASAAVATTFLKQLGKHGSAGLPHLRHVTLTVGDGVPGGVDLRPLVHFAATLKTLVVVSWGPSAAPVALTAQQLWAMEDAISQLTALEYVDVSALPTARCFMGGAHTRLRELFIGGTLLTGATGVCFRRVAAACPNLTSARGRTDAPRDDPACDDAATGEDHTPPNGWRLEFDGTVKPTCAVPLTMEQF